jgi:hypothetical protein
VRVGVRVRVWPRRGRRASLKGEGRAGEER